MVLSYAVEFHTLCLLSVFHSVISENNTVLYVSLMYRHGARTPISLTPRDPYRDLAFWPDDWGELTNIGKQQQYELGQWLQDRYASLLTHGYQHELIRVLSTDTDRTIMSAQLNLAGMFPPTNAGVWNPELLWQPIPVHTVPETLDDMLSGKKPCPAYQEELDRVLHSKEIEDLKKSYQDVFDAVSKYSGRTINTIEQVDWIRSDFEVEAYNGYELPEWTRKNKLLTRLQEISMYSFIIPTFNKKLARLRMGVFHKEMIENMKRKVEDKNFLRAFNMYSGHDLTISALLDSMGVFNKRFPPFAACVLIELIRTSAGEHKVLIFYRNETIGEPISIKLPGCARYCPLDEWIKIMEPVTIKDWDTECQSQSHVVYIVVAVAILIILGLLLIAGVAYFVTKKKKSSHSNRPANVENNTTIGTGPPGPAKPPPAEN